MADKTTTERRQHFHQLITEAEENFAKHPSAYRRKLALLASLGYVYIFGVLLVTILLIGLSVLGAIKSTFFLLLLLKKKLIIVLLMVFYVLIKALWVKLDAPTGYELTPKQCPMLFEELNALRKQLKAPKIHQVILEPGCNASIAETPRIGIFGWNKNTLTLGLTLMLTMSHEQVISVIAHEYGHLSGNHSHFAGWIYRVRMTWMRIMNAFDEAGGWAHIVFGKFFDWYAPYFNAYSFALARANEFEADAVAVEVTSASAFTSALNQTHIAPDLLDKHYWERINQQVGQTETVNTRIYSGLYQHIKEQRYADEEKMQLLQKSLKVTTGKTDTHPALKDRIAPYIQGEPELPEFPAHNAAESLLGEHLQAVIETFDREWATHNEAWWKERYQYLSQSRKELHELEQKAGKETLTDDELWNLAAWTEEFKSDEDPLPRYQNYLERHPDDASASYAVGRILLAQGEESGVQYLDKSMSNRHALIPACELIYAHYKERHESDKAEEYRLKAEKHMDLEDEANRERADLYQGDVYLSAELSDEWIQHLSQQFSQIDGIKKAWVCRKQVEVFPDEPIYVFIFASKTFASNDKITENILESLQAPGMYFVISNQGDHKKLAKKALNVATQLID